MSSGHVHWYRCRVVVVQGSDSDVGLRLLVRFEKSLLDRGSATGMCGLRQDSCLWGPAGTQGGQGVFGTFLQFENCDKNRHRHPVKSVALFYEPEEVLNA